MAVSDASIYFATAPSGAEAVLQKELVSLGAQEVHVGRSGVSFAGTLTDAYRVCLWSRVANRVLLRLAKFPARDPEELYQGIKALPWEDHLAVEGTLAVDCRVHRSPITHSRYAALKTKDAICDRFRDRDGRRPSVDVDHPHLRINLFLFQEDASVGIDLSGESLHRRGYRVASVAASLKENLAAALLLRAKWPDICAQGGALVDPTCGAGTLPIEAAGMAGDIAPGLGRSYFGFLGWRGHDRGAWESLLEEAQTRRAAGAERIPRIVASDHDPRAIQKAEQNAERAGLGGAIQFVCRDLDDVRPPAPRGLVIANPPYGHRVGVDLERLYGNLGRVLKEHFGGWNAAVFSSLEGLEIGLRPREVHQLRNGPLSCRLSHFFVAPTESSGVATSEPRSSGAEMLANRLRKNLRILKKWARRNHVYAYRLYDADLPDYAMAIDIYESDERWVQLQEYAPPPEINPRKAEERRREALALVPELLDVPPRRVHYKLRRRQRHGPQSERLADRGQLIQVQEGDAQLWINLTDHQDTGLYLNHRETRSRLAEMAPGQHFLNLFAYTGVTSVHAGLAGARSTTSVDLSHTYLDWAERNLHSNGLRGPHHRLIQGDVLEYIAHSRPDRNYGLIFLNPPSFSRSKRLRDDFEVQRDHPILIGQALRWLSPGGTLVFSTHARSFKLRLEDSQGCEVRDWTDSTIPQDFRRTRPHRVWAIRRPLGPPRPT